MRGICNPVLEKIIGGCDGTPGDVSIAVVVARLYQAVLIVGGLALLIFLVWGGIRWLTAGGDKGKVEEAQHQITNAVIGMVFLVATIAIVTLLNYVFGFDVLNPTLGS